MINNVSDALKKEEPMEFHGTLLQRCLSDVRRSRGEMSKYYSKWDLQDQVYRGEREFDADDRKQAAADAPTKMIVPNTFAQVMSFASFLFLMFKQNDKPFELEPTGTEDYGKKWSDCEAVLKRDWIRSRGSKILFQHLLDIGRFGVAPLEITWSKEETKVFVDQPSPITQMFNGVELQSSSEASWQTFTKFEGNRVRNVSPYRWFPDTAFPICDFHLGDFCASEEDFTMAGLRALEKTGEVAGVEWIKALPNSSNLEGTRGGPSRFTFTVPSEWDKDSPGSPVVVTKMRRKIIPKDFLIDEKRPLGDEEFPILYTIWIANDNRIIRLEPCQEWHQQFGFGVGQFTPDMHHTLSMGLADLVYRLQDVISWYINSHITSVRRVILNRNIINPSLIESKSYDGDGDIYLRKGLGRIDPRLAVSQLAAQDVTSGHMNDVDIIGKLMQMVSGVNDNAMGQYNSGRRSATEARVVTGGAAGRMKMHGHLIWESSLSRIGSMMLSNSRQSLSRDSFIRALGGGHLPDIDQRFSAFQGTPEEVICGEDYLGFDSTLSSEKGYMAQNIQELLSILLQSNPAAAAQITQKLDPMKLIGEIQYLRDGTPIERFNYDPGQQPSPPMMQPMAPPQPQVS